jgi:rod shape-determining protein MreC
MFEEKEFFQSPKLFFILLISFSVLFLVFHFVNIEKHFVNAGGVLVKPMQELASNSSKSIKNFFGVFHEIKVLRNDYFDIKEAYLKLESESNLLVLLKEENTSLKQQLGLDVEGTDILLAEVLYQDLNLRNESMLINKGQKDGLSVGDVVSMGNLYIGILAEVQEHTSKVRLATSRASSLKVMILDKDVDTSFEPQTYLTGIAVGYSNSLKIENIESHGELKEGDVIVLNDSKVGKFLYLGNVVSIDQDPTATLRSTNVSLPVEYTSLKYVFVERGE